MSGSTKKRSASNRDDAVAAEIATRLTAIVGAKYVLTGEHRTKRYRTGYRFGGGPVAAVVRPGTLVEQWRVLQACVAAQAVVIMQAAKLSRP